MRAMGHTSDGLKGSETLTHSETDERLQACGVFEGVATGRSSSGPILLAVSEERERERERERASEAHYVAAKHEVKWLSLRSAADSLELVIAAPLQLRDTDLPEEKHSVC